jgi:hypothetical protein
MTIDMYHTAARAKDDPNGPDAGGALVARAAIKLVGESLNLFV